MAIKVRKKRPKTVLHAGNEINRLGAGATMLALSGNLPTGLRIALQACLQAYAKVQASAISAAGIARDRMDADPNYGDPWKRQWTAANPPVGDDELMHELPLWYLAQILRNIRELMRRDAGLAWDTSPDDWKRIAAAMRVAKDALVCGSLEARATASTRLKEGRTEKKKSKGPDLDQAPMANVVPLRA